MSSKAKKTDINCRVICNNKNNSDTCLTCPVKSKTAHGVEWEKPVCKYILSEMGYTGVEKEKLYQTWLKNSQKETTAIHDIDPHLLGLNNWRPEDKEIFGEGVSVKLICMKGDVCMGDLGRIFNNFKHKWSMIVGFYTVVTKKNEKCLCIKSVWYLPFKENKKDREKIFGDIDNWDNWNKSLQILKDYVIEARTYKKGYGGLASLKNDESTQLSSFKNIKNIKKEERKNFSIKNMCDFDSLTKVQRTNRLKTGLKKNSTIQEIKEQQKKCIEKIETLREILFPEKSRSIIKPAIKLDGDQNRVQGRISYTSFLKYVKENGFEITKHEHVINNDVLGPIHKK
tara:strand:- start:2729 stop:3751 length:1023 start_codon:yes stop_codon:yes gene_type:complete